MIYYYVMVEVVEVLVVVEEDELIVVVDDDPELIPVLTCICYWIDTCLLLISSAAF